MTSGMFHLPCAISIPHSASCPSKHLALGKSDPMLSLTTPAFLAQPLYLPLHGPWQSLSAVAFHTTHSIFTCVTHKHYPQLFLLLSIDCHLCSRHCRGCTTTSRDAHKLCNKVNQVCCSSCGHGLRKPLVKHWFCRYFFVSTKLRVQPLILPTIIRFSQDIKSIHCTISNNPLILALAHTETSILGNLLVVTRNSMDCSSFLARKKFKANIVPELLDLLPPNSSDDPHMNWSEFHLNSQFHLAAMWFRDLSMTRQPRAFSTTSLSLLVTSGPLKSRYSLQTSKERFWNPILPNHSTPNSTKIKPGQVCLWSLSWESQRTTWRLWQHTLQC